MALGLCEEVSANMIFSYNWLQSFFKQKLPKPEKLAEILTLHFAEVEEVKKVGKDFAIDIDVRPNRAGDCFSHWGIAREISAITHLTFYPGGEKVKLIEDKKLKSGDFVSIGVKDKNTCLRYTARVILDVKIAPSPKRLQERLITCGLRPINNVVDITNYVMLNSGQPLHAFDGEKIEDKKIVVRFAKRGEEIITLDDQRCQLDENVLVIADSRKPIGIAGIKGGKNSGIDEKTKIVVLESANFHPQVIRKGSRALDLKTDASLRFEHGIDPNLTEKAINQAAYLIQEIAKGKVAKGIIDFYPKKVLPKIIKLDLDYLERLLGVKIPENEIKKILESLGLKIENWKLKILTVFIPTFRQDISIPEDLIEEIGRIYGYQKIPSISPLTLLKVPEKNLDLFWEDFSKDVLKEMGFTEVYNYCFFSEKDKEIFGQKNLIELENPLSQDYKYLRTSLIPNLLKNVQKNQKQFKEIRIFELGRIFLAPKKEKRMLTGLIFSKEKFFEGKGIVETLLNKMRISNLWYDQYQPTPEDSELKIWQKDKCAEIKVDGEEIGFLGEISKDILENLKIENDVLVFDLDFEKLAKLACEEHEFRPISPYPAAIRDIAVLVPRETRVEEVLNVIEIAGGELVRDVDLFDIYEGEALPEDKKNLAFHIVFQAEDRTLSSKEINEIQNKIIAALEENLDWQIRK